MVHQRPQASQGDSWRKNKASPVAQGFLLLVTVVLYSALTPIRVALAVPPPGCSGLTITGSRTILLNPSDIGGYAVMFHTCTLTGSLIIDSTASGVAHWNATVDIENSTAATFTIASGVLLGAGSRIRVKGLSGVSAVTIAGSAKDGAALFFSFLSLVTTGPSGGLTISGSFATQSRLLLDFCSLKATLVQALTVNSAAFTTGSHFNITNSVVSSPSAVAFYWIGTSAASSTPLGSYPTTIVALFNTSISGRGAFFMHSTSSGIQSGALLHIAGGCVFAVGGTTDVLLSLQLKGGRVFHDATNRFPSSGPTGLPFGTVFVYLTTAADAGGQFFAICGGSNISEFGWLRTATLSSKNDTIIVEDARFSSTVALQVGQATGLNVTLRRIVITGTGGVEVTAAQTITDASFLIEDSALDHVTQSAPSVRAVFAVLRSNISGTLVFAHPATGCSVQISKVRAHTISIELARVQSPVRVEDTVVINALKVDNAHTDSGATVVRCTVGQVLVASAAWLRSPVILEDVVALPLIQIGGTHTDGLVRLNRTTAGVLKLMTGSGLVRTALVVHHSTISTSSKTETVRLENTWNAALLDVFNSTVTSVGQDYAVYVVKTPLNGSQHRFVDSVLVSTTTTYPAGTGPLRGAVVYAVGFGAGGLLEMRGTRLQAGHANAYLLYVEVSGSRLYYDRSNACSRHGGIPNRGRLYIKTLLAGATGDVVRINNSDVDDVDISLAAGTDSEVSISNTAIAAKFTLSLGDQLGFLHQMVNTVVGGALSMTCSGVIANGSVLLHGLRAAAFAHTATAISGGCYSVQHSTVGGTYLLTAALQNGIDMSFNQNALYALQFKGQHTNTSLLFEGNRPWKNTGASVFLHFDVEKSANVTWRIQNNNMTGAGHSIMFLTSVLVSDGVIAILNNTLGPYHGVYMVSGSGIGYGSTLWLRDNRIMLDYSTYGVNINMRGGRLDHDGSNAYSGLAGLIGVSMAAADSGGHYFALRGGTIKSFVWLRSLTVASQNETVWLHKTVIDGFLVQQGTCVDCRLVVERSVVLGSATIDVGVRSSSNSADLLMAPTPGSARPCSSSRSVVCLVTSRFASSLYVQGAFEGPFSSMLQLLNTTFLHTVTVAASFAVTTTISNSSNSNTTAHVVGTDVVNCTFFNSPTGPSLVFSSAFTAPPVNASAMVVIQIRDSDIKATTGSGIGGVHVSAPSFGANSRLIVQNLFCTTVSTSNPCLKVHTLDAAWVEVWNSSFFGGGMQIFVTSAAKNMLIVGNRVPLAGLGITGAMATVGGGRVAACNQDSSTAGWPAIAVGGAVGFSNLPCNTSQAVTRCGPAGGGGQAATVTGGGQVPFCMDLSTDAGEDPLALASPNVLNMSRFAFQATSSACILVDLNPPPPVQPPVLPPMPTQTKLLTLSAPSASLSGATLTYAYARTRSARTRSTRTRSARARSITSSLPTSISIATRQPSPSIRWSPSPSPSAASAAVAPSSTLSPLLPHHATATAPFLSPATSLPPATPPLDSDASTTPNVTTTAATSAGALTAPSSTPADATSSSPFVSATPPPTTPCASASAEITSAAVITLQSSNDAPGSTSGGTATRSSVVGFPLPMTVLDSANTSTASPGSALTPIWHPTAGSAALAAWFLTDMAPHVSCATDPASLSPLLVCRLPSRPLPDDPTFGVTVATTLEATVQLRPCPAAPLRLILSLVRPQPGPAASAATVVVLTVGLVGTTAYTLLVEPWAVEPLVLAGILDGPCAPPAVQDAARVAIYALNPFAALTPALAGGLLILLVIMVSGVNALVAAFLTRKKAEHWTRFIGRGLFPRVSFAVAVAALPGVAWAAAAAIRGGPSGGAVVGVLSCAAYVVAVPCGGALVVIRLAPARFVQRRVAPSEHLWVRLLFPTGRWTTDGCTAVPAAMNVRGLTAGPRGGELLFVGSSLLATSVFAMTIAPPASASCAARHYAVAVLFGAAAIIIAVLRPHRAPFTTVMTVLILIFACAAAAAVGAVADDPSAPHGPSAGLATTAAVLSVVRSVHAVVMARKKVANRFMMDKSFPMMTDENLHESAADVDDDMMIIRDSEEDSDSL